MGIVLLVPCLRVRGSRRQCGRGTRLGLSSTSVKALPVSTRGMSTVVALQALCVGSKQESSPKRGQIRTIRAKGTEIVPTQLLRSNGGALRKAWTFLPRMHLRETKSKGLWLAEVSETHGGNVPGAFGKWQLSLSRDRTIPRR